jgi:hypothetical protein
MLLNADAHRGQEQQLPSIIDVRAAHLLDHDMAREKGLVLVPYTNGTLCGAQPDHPKPLKVWFRQLQANIVATAEAHHPGDTGALMVSPSLIRLLQLHAYTWRTHLRSTRGQYCTMHLPYSPTPSQMLAHAACIVHFYFNLYLVPCSSHHDNF